MDSNSDYVEHSETDDMNTVMILSGMSQHTHSYDIW